MKYLRNFLIFWTYKEDEFQDRDREFYLIFLFIKNGKVRKEGKRDKEQ